MSDRGEMWVHGNSVVAQYLGGDGAALFTPGHRMVNAIDPAHREFQLHGGRVPGSDVLGVRSESGATFRGAFGGTELNNTNWFHFSIPTPAIAPWPTPENRFDYREITVDIVSVYYKFRSEPASDQITIQRVLVSDAGTDSQEVPSILSNRGRPNSDHTAGPVAGANSWTLRQPMRLVLGKPHGILISVEVRFAVEGEITFTAAAIHYKVN